jgi:hypothetical protein
VAPGEDVVTAYVPGQVYQKSAGGNVFGEDLRYIYGRDLFLRIAHTFLYPGRELFALIGKIDYRDIFTGDPDVLQQDGKSAF